MIALTTLIVGLLIGILYRTGWDFIKETHKRFESVPPQVGATHASYGKTNEFNVNQPGPTGLVTPKTPQMLEWEESERLREMQYKVEMRN